MPEARTFGRRGAAPAAPGPAWEPPPVIPDRGGGTTDRLSATSRKFRIAGELLGYGGLLVILLAAVAQTLDTHDVGFSKIYIPSVLAGAVDFASPAAALVTEHMLPMVGNIAWALLFVTGMIAATRGRWLLTGLCAVTLAVPWTWFGVLLPFAPIMLVLIAAAAGLKLYRPRGMKLVVTLVLALVIGPGVVIFGTQTVDRILNPGGLAAAKYHVVNFDELKQNANLSTTYVDKRGKTVKRVATLDGLTAATPEARGAKAFVLAQERTMRGDVAGTVVALEEIASSAFKPNMFERDRLTVARNFAVSHGAYGEDARRAFQGAADLQQTLGSVTWYIGLGLGLLGPFADIIAGRIGRRSKRIDAAQQALEEHRTLGVTAPAGRKGFGRIDTGAAIQSIAALDGEAVLKAISKRMRLYGGSAAVFGVLSVLALGAGALMWLPPAESNTAFSDIGLSGAVSYRWARELGVPVVIGPTNINSLVTMLFMPMLMVVLATVIFFRRFAIYVAGAVLAALVYWQLSSFFFVDQPQYSTAPASFTAEVRGNLERTPSLQPALKGYVLAQLAYVENRPADIAPLLETVAADRTALDVLAHEQRFDIMREWAIVRGYEVDGNIAGFNMIAPMAVSRAASLPVTILGALAGLLGLTAVALFPVAARRRQRISALVEQVHFRQGEYRGVQP